MKRIEDSELKAIQLRILDRIDSFCKDYNLKYYLAYGTLLGAVRHKGFIPWDDDIDLFMPRKDYDFLVSFFNEKSSNYKLFSFKDKGYLYQFAKVVFTDTILIERHMKTNILGVNVDIFPLDNLPPNKKDSTRFKKSVMRLHYLQLIATRKLKKRSTFFKTIVSLLLYFPLAIFGYKNLLSMLDKKSKKYNNLISSYVANLSLDTYLFKEQFDINWFGDGVMLEFEGKMYPAPSNYDSVLKQIYGQYHVLPPKNRRIRTHDNEAYWKED